MTSPIDLRDESEADRRELLFDALGRLAPGERIDIVATQDIDPHLLRYQLDHERAMEWEYEHPDTEPRELAVTMGEPIEDGWLPAVDVRDLKPQRRHNVLLEIFDQLEAAEGFVLVNDHDPRPLYHELRSLHGDIVDWEYVNKEVGEWQVAIRKNDDSVAEDDDIITRYDVREIPKQERHPTIHHRYGMIPEGETMELIAPHEPAPLHREFQRQYGDSFTWEVVDAEPGKVRVRITKRGAVEGSATATDGEADPSAASIDQELAVTEELDVRELPPAQRHERIFAAYDELVPGTGFVLVNDHDPKPLYHQFDAEAGPAFRWEYRQQEPGEFRVMIGKAAVDGEGSPDGEAEAPF